ncbi:hypothetical protein IC615_17810 [Serratia ureilytica]
MKKFYATLGNTPLVEVPSPKGKASIYAKFEFENPFGSVKDRTAFGLFCDAINQHDFAAGELKLLDSSGQYGESPGQAWQYVRDSGASGDPGFVSATAYRHVKSR